MKNDDVQRKGLCCSKPLIMPLKEHVLRIITTKLKVDKLIVNLSCVKRNPMFVFRIIFRFRGIICWQGLFLLKVKCTSPSKSFIKMDVLKEIFCNVKFSNISKIAFLTSFYDTYQIEMEIFIPYNKNYLFH